MYLTFPIIYLTVALLISPLICLNVWRNPNAPARTEFIFTWVSSVVWILGEILARCSPDVTFQWIAECIRFIGVVTLPVGITVFVFKYCRSKLSTKTIVWLLVIPSISWLVLITNPLHYLFFTEVLFSKGNPLNVVKQGWYFWLIHSPYSYGLLMISVVKSFMELGRSSRHYRRQIIILSFSLCIPIITSAFVVSRALTNEISTSLSFPIFFTLMGISMSRFEFLKSYPIAYETVFTSIREGVVILDQKDIILDINPSAAASLNKKPKEIIGLSLSKAFADWKETIDKYEEKTDVYDEIEVLINGKSRFLSIRIAPINNSENSIDGRIITFSDITSRRKHQNILETLAFHDPLTRLANRRKFEEEVQRAFKTSRENGENFAILYFDLNRFKNINDTMGHEVGDEFLKYVAARIASILRKPDTLARLGGDEFAALLHNCDELGIEVVVERILDNVQRPFRIKNHTIIADLSIGASLYPDHGETFNQLLRHADTAMYQAKSEGGGLNVYTEIIESQDFLQ